MGTKSEFEFFEEFFKRIQTLALTDVKTIATSILTYAQSREEQNINYLKEQTPQFPIPAHLMMSYSERVLISFLQELFANFDKDYRLRNPHVPVNDNSIVIENAFPSTTEGNYPRIVVECQGMNTSPFSLNYGANADGIQMGVFSNVTTMSGSRSTYVDLPMTMYCIAANRDEANNLASLITFALYANMDIINALFGMYQITSPSVSGAALIRNFSQSKVFMSTIRFTMRRVVSWSIIYKIKAFSSFVLRLIAKMRDPDNDAPIIQSIYRGKFPLDPSVKAYLDKIEEAYKDK